jgi:hypothetical protein
MVHLDLLCLQTKKITFININESVSKKKITKKQTKSHKTVTPLSSLAFPYFYFFQHQPRIVHLPFTFNVKKKKKHTISFFSPSRYNTINPYHHLHDKTTIDSRAYPLHHQPNVGSSSSLPRHMSNT